jgi:2-iminobutanoate/2-iminopropanoate deaminase
MKVETLTPAGSPEPIGAYSHVAMAGGFITIGGLGGIDPKTGVIAGPDVGSQTRRILQSFDEMLRTVGSDLGHVLHVHVFLKDMADFQEMNAAFAEAMGTHRPARTVIAAKELPKPQFRVLMNLTAVQAGA